MNVIDVLVFRVINVTNEGGELGVYDQMNEISTFSDVC